MTSPSGGPSVSVIVPARRASAHVEAAIRSCLDQDGVGEVVVAVADEETRQAAARVCDRRVTVVDNPDGSTPAGLNRALEKASGDIVVRCDAHAVLPPGYVAAAVRLLEETGAVNVGGRQVPVGETFFERAVALAMRSRFGAGDARYRVGGDPGPVDTVYLGVFRRSALEAVGGFDESLARNQDYELNWRLRRAGGVVWFDPGLAVHYRPRGSVRALWRQYFGYGYWKTVVLRRHPRSLRWRQLAPPTLVLVLAVSTMAGISGRRGAGMVPVAYLATTAAVAMAEGTARREPAAVLEPAALWTMHLAWGTGFIVGLLSGRRHARHRRPS